MSTDTPLNPEIFEILLALAEGPAHGWGIVQEVESRTDGRIELAPSLLYRRLRRLVEDGLVEEAGEAPGERGRPRKEYALTHQGRARVRAEARRLVDLASERAIRDLAGESG